MVKKNKYRGRRREVLLLRAIAVQEKGAVCSAGGILLTVTEQNDYLKKKVRKYRWTFEQFRAKKFFLRKY